MKSTTPQRLALCRFFSHGPVEVDVGGLIGGPKMRRVFAAPIPPKTKAIEQLIEIQKACASALVAEMRALRHQTAKLADELISRL